MGSGAFWCYKQGVAREYAKRDVVLQEISFVLDAFWNDPEGFMRGARAGVGGSGKSIQQQRRR